MKVGDLVKVLVSRETCLGEMLDGKVGIITKSSWWDTRNWEVMIGESTHTFSPEELGVINKSDKGENND